MNPASPSRSTARAWLPVALLLMASTAAVWLVLGCAAGGGGGTLPPVELAVPPAHHLGEDCSASSCHDPSASLTHLSAAGTVYTDAAGSAPAAGVTVRLQQVANPAVSVTATTNQDGNFALRETALDPAKKYSISITDGVTTQTMPAPKIPPLHCNWCHAPSGNAGFRVNLQGAPEP